MRLSDLIRKLEDSFFGTKQSAESPQAPRPPFGPQPETMEERIAALRKTGVRIGDGCMIFTTDFSTEPYLVDIGDHVGISGGTKFLTHDGSVWLVRPEHPHAQVLGRIRVGENTFIGENCIILPGTTIGRGCVIGAGSVVRGEIPDNSIVLGNPARVVGRASLLKGARALLDRTLDTYHLPEPERETVIRRHFGV